MKLKGVWANYFVFSNFRVNSRVLINNKSQVKTCNDTSCLQCDVNTRVGSNLSNSSYIVNIISVSHFEDGMQQLRCTNNSVLLKDGLLYPKNKTYNENSRLFQTLA